MSARNRRGRRRSGKRSGSRGPSSPSPRGSHGSRAPRAAQHPPSEAQLRREARELARDGRIELVAHELEDLLQGVSAASAFSDDVLGLRRLAVFYDEMHRGEDVLPTLEKAVEIAEARDDVSELSTALVDLGRAYRRAGREDEAFEVFQRALDVDPKSGDPAMIEVLLRMGDRHADRKELQDAMTAYRRAARLARDRRRGAEEASALESLGSLLVRDRRHGEAEDVLRRACRLAEQKDVPAILARAAAALAEVHARQGAYDLAEDVLAQAVQSARDAGEDALLQRCLRRLAERQRRGRMAAKARELLDEAQTILERLGEAEELLRLRLESARVHRDLAHHDEARAELEALLAALAGRDGALAREAWDLLGDVELQAERPERARECFQRVVDLAGAAGRHREEADALVELASANQALGEHEPALEILQRAFDGAVAARALRTAGRALALRARWLEERGDFERARAAHEERLSHYEQQGDGFGCALTLHDLGSLEARQGRHDAAIEAYGRAVERAERSGKTLEVARIQKARGESLLALGRMDDARRSLGRAARALLEFGRSRDASDAWNEIAQTYPKGNADDDFRELLRTTLVEENGQGADRASQGLLDRARVLMQFSHLEDARSLLERAIKAWKPREGPRLACAIRQALGQTYRYSGKYSHAVRWFGERVAKERERGHDRDLAFALNSLGAAQTDLGDVKGALGSFEEAIRIVEALEDPGALALILNGYAMALHRAGRTAEALEQIERGRAMQAESGQLPDVAVALNVRGEIHRERGDHEAARRDLEESYALQVGQGDERGLAYVIPRLGLARLEAGDVEASVELLERGLELSRHHPDRRQYVLTQRALGRALLTAGCRETATQHLRLALSLAEKMDEKALTSELWELLSQRTPG